MSNLPNDSDSTQLAGLRYDYCRGGFTRPCTADRLGAYAWLLGYIVTDFGAHSKRWVRRFNERARKP